MHTFIQNSHFKIKIHSKFLSSNRHSFKIPVNLPKNYRVVDKGQAGHCNTLKDNDLKYTFIQNSNLKIYVHLEF